MGSSRIRRKRTPAACGIAVATLALMPARIGQQDLTAFIARQTGAAERARAHLIASPFGTIHAATFSFPRPLGTLIPEPVGFRLASLNPRDLDVTGSLGEAAPVPSRAPQPELPPLVFPTVNRALKGDRLAPRAQPVGPPPEGPQNPLRSARPKVAAPVAPDAEASDAHAHMSPPRSPPPVAADVAGAARAVEPQRLRSRLEAPGVAAAPNLGTQGSDPAVHVAGGAANQAAAVAPNLAPGVAAAPAAARAALEKSPAPPAASAIDDLAATSDAMAKDTAAASFVDVVMRETPAVLRPVAPARAFGRAPLEAPVAGAAAPAVAAAVKDGAKASPAAAFPAAAFPAAAHPALARMRLFFGVEPMGVALAPIEPWAPGEQPLLADPDIKLSALAPQVAAPSGVGAGETVAGKGEVTGEGQRPRSPAERLALSAKARVKAEKCLAEAVYFEARGEPERGQKAVAQVVINRVFSGFYPGNVCGVVYQNAHRKLACQFTFACDGIPDRVTEPELWTQAKRIAHEALDGKFWLPEIGTATHYHATYVHPWWVSTMRKHYRIGVHIFYRPRRWGDGADMPVWGAAPAAKVKTSAGTDAAKKL